MIRDQDDLAIENGFADAAHFRRMIARSRCQAIRDGSRGEVRAHVNHGRWLVDCPLCNGAEMVSRGEALFFCLSCGMVSNDGYPMHVIFPRGRKRIEELLQPRPESAQNWQPGETVEMLIAENLEHGHTISALC